jgi:hypothetical protein
MVTCGFTPSEIADMTWEQQLLAFREMPDDDSGLKRFNTIAEARAFQQMVKGKQ